MNETRIEAEEIKANAWAAYKRGDITLEDALDIIRRAERDAVMETLILN